MLRTLLIAFVLLLILSFFGISIRTILTSPTGKDNLTFVWELIHTGIKIFENYLFSIINNLKEIGAIVGSTDSN